MYYNQEIVTRYKGNKIYQLLSTQPLLLKVIKFNQHLKFAVYLQPTRHISTSTSMSIHIMEMSNEIDYFIMSWELSCSDNNSTDYKCKWCRIFKEEQHMKIDLSFIADIYKLKDAKQVLFTFNILSMQIKYKSNQTIYYPSLAAIQLNETSSLK